MATTPNMTSFADMSSAERAPDMTGALGHRFFDLCRNAKATLAVVSLVANVALAACQLPEATETVVAFKGLKSDMQAKGLRIVDSPVKAYSPETRCTATRIAGGWLTLARHCINGVPGLHATGAARTDGKPAVLKGNQNHWFSLWGGKGSSQRLGDIDAIVRGDDTTGPDFAIVHESGANNKDFVPISVNRPRAGKAYTISGYPTAMDGKRTTDSVVYLGSISGALMPNIDVPRGERLDVFGLQRRNSVDDNYLRGYSGATVIGNGAGYSIVTNGVPNHLPVGLGKTIRELLAENAGGQKGNYDLYALATPLTEDLVERYKRCAAQASGQC